MKRIVSHLAVVVIAIVNVPMIAACLKFGHSEQLPVILGQVPGQFLFLAAVFPIIAVLLSVVTIRGARLILAEAPGGFCPRQWFALLCPIIAVLPAWGLAWADSRESGSDLFVLIGAERHAAHYSMLSRVRDATNGSKSAASRVDDVGGAESAGSPAGTQPSALAADLQRVMSKTGEAAHADPLMKRLDAIEGWVALWTASVFSLYVVAVFLLRTAAGSDAPPSPPLRRIAMLLTACLGLFAAFPALRMHTFLEYHRVIGAPHTAYPAPFFAIGVILILGGYLTTVFVQRQRLVEAVKVLWPLALSAIAFAIQAVKSDAFRELISFRLTVPVLVGCLVIYPFLIFPWVRFLLGDDEPAPEPRALDA